MRPHLSMPPVLVALIVMAPPAGSTVAYTVTDLGAMGATNQPWSISASGFVVGYSAVGAHDEGFVFDGTSSVLIGTPPGTSRTDLLGVNALGHAVGKSGTVYENGEAILWMDDGTPDGLIRSLGTLGGSRSAATSINDAGQIVGWTKLEGDAESRPFIWENDEMTALPLLGGTQGAAEWINASGQIVGGSTTDADGLQQFAVLWDDGDVTRLPPFHAGLNNIAYFIHDNGDIAGSVRTPDPGGHPPDGRQVRGAGGFDTRAAIWRDGEVFLELGTLADGSPAEAFASSWASAINADGVVVGMSVNAQSSLVPFVTRDGEMVQLDTLMPDGWVASFVGSGAINDAGEIVVSGFMPGETGTRALLLTPIPAVGVPEVASSAPGAGLVAVPNPFRHATTIRIDAGADAGADARVDAGSKVGASRIDVLTVTGRLVRSLDLSEADRRVTWDGRDTNGRRVPAGVYFVRGASGSATRVMRIR